MSKNWNYVSGNWNVVCDVCSKKIKASEAKQRWDGFIVCKDDYEQRQPLDFIRARQDKISVPFTRPVPTDTFVPQNFTENLTDQVYQIEDRFVPITSYIRNMEDSTSVVDLIAFGYAVIASEAVVVSDIIQVELILGLNLSDTISISDIVIKADTKFITEADIPMSDSYLADVSITQSDTISSADTTTSLVGNTITDTTVVIDTLNTLSEYYRDLESTVLVTDLLPTVTAINGGGINMLGINVNSLELLANTNIIFGLMATTVIGGSAINETLIN